MDEATNQNTPTTTPPASSSDRARSAKEVISARRKFTNLVNGRVTRALHAIRVVANLSKMEASKDQMADADVEAIMAALDREVAICRKRLTSAATGQQLDVEFELDGSPKEPGV